MEDKERKSFSIVQEKSISLAESWLNRANELISSDEKKIQNQMLQLLKHPVDKVILMQLLDQSFRSDNAERSAEQINYILKKYGIPTFFSHSEKFLAFLFQYISPQLPNLSVPLLIDQVRKETGRLIIPGETEEFKAHLEKRRAEGVRMNINHLGEALLGEEEAKHRLEAYISTLNNPYIECISVKISTIYSQINSLAFNETVEVLSKRLAALFKAAKENLYQRANGNSSVKLVNLDMEEYRDLDITIAAFKKTLELNEFNDYTAGIVLQSYLPDSYQKLVDLTKWARKRVSNGGAPIRIRFVKGANLEMEKLEANLRNWKLATYSTKLDVDTNYKKMLEYATRTKNIKAVHLGIASHNLFELAFAYNLARENNCSHLITFEMLEGMADHIRRAIMEITGDVLVYAPEAEKEQFINAIGYLVRRLDENTGSENFLSHSFNLKVKSKEWKYLEQQFVDSIKNLSNLSNQVKRDQNRLEEEKTNTRIFDTKDFVNEADTDWTLEKNREWVQTIKEKWKLPKQKKFLKMPPVINGKEVFAKAAKEIVDRSQSDLPLIGTGYLADWKQAEKALNVAAEDSGNWRKTLVGDRHRILSLVAQELRNARADLIGAAVAGNGKTFTEADIEVSEAIDFAEYYALSACEFGNFKNVKAEGKGVVLVIPPWNFPIAIPAGGILAALAAGNTVILKPATDAILPAWILCHVFWKAGISKKTLQFVPASSSSGVPDKMVQSPLVDAVIFTGGTATAMDILKSNPSLQLTAETGGKNATIVTCMADRDQAIKHVIHSAFSHSGQKCSATSLLILEEEIYYDKNFRRQLIDAVNSIKVGSAWDLDSKMGPLNAPPSGDLKNAMNNLEKGEFWALEPLNIDANPYLWRPGIKWGVKAGSYSHLTEFFGPVLSVMKAKNLEEAIELVNATGYGLTSGLESLDEREHQIWKEKIKAGNLYINRGTTGAIVLRQPFGGTGKSAIGSGIKAGGPNYVSQFMNFHSRTKPDFGDYRSEHPLEELISRWENRLDYFEPELQTDIEKAIFAIRSYLYHADNYFSKEHDFFNIPGQDNILRYMPVGKILIRLHAKGLLFDTLARIAAARIAGNEIILSIPPELANEVTRFISDMEVTVLLEGVEIKRQTDEQMLDYIPQVDLIRYTKRKLVPEIVFQKAAENAVYISHRHPLLEGRIEMLEYYKEQSISYDYHRYGNISARTLNN